MKYKPKPRFKTGFLLPEAAGRQNLVGRLLPQPEIVVDGHRKLLDETIGHGFVLLVRGEQAQTSFGKLRQPIWDRLGVARVAVLPAGSAASVVASVGEGITVVSETDETLAQTFKSVSDCALLLRPDRYVAAIIPLADPQPFVAALEKLLANTWEQPGQSTGRVKKAGQAPNKPPDEGLPSTTVSGERRAA